MGSHVIPPSLKEKEVLLSFYLNVYIFHMMHYVEHITAHSLLIQLFKLNSTSPDLTYNWFRRQRNLAGAKQR